MGSSTQLYPQVRGRGTRSGSDLLRIAAKQGNPLPPCGGGSGRGGDILQRGHIPKAPSPCPPPARLIFTQKSSGHKQSSAPFHRGRPSKRTKRIAPKGWKKIARANGPGPESVTESALKGRNQRLSRPLRAPRLVWTFSLPPALFLGPFGAWAEMAAGLPRASPGASS